MSINKGFKELFEDLKEWEEVEINPEKEETLEDIKWKMEFIEEEMPKMDKEYNELIKYADNGNDVAEWRCLEISRYMMDLHRDYERLKIKLKELTDNK